MFVILAIDSGGIALSLVRKVGRFLASVFCGVSNVHFMSTTTNQILVALNIEFERSIATAWIKPLSLPPGLEFSINVAVRRSGEQGNGI
jgi:hypothetical protein